MKKVSIASAPGKIHLIGEHSSVYGKPAILAAIDKRVFVKISRSKTDNKDGALLAIQKYLKKNYKTPIESFEIETSGNLPVGQGLGSSAAYSAALTTALFDFYKLPFDHDEVYKASYEGEKYFHGNPSGGDLAAVVYGGVIYFRKETEGLKLIKKITPKKSLHFFAVDSGRPGESTKEMVMKVSQLPKKQLDKFCMDQEVLAKKMADEIIGGLEVSKTLIDAEKNLEKIGVVGKRAKKIIKDLNSIGLPAKISGGGGIKDGSGMILVEKPGNFKSSNLYDKKFDVINFTVENSGVRIEKPKKITVSAPGKLMLFGEHAVVYGHPCIVTAVDQRMFLKAEGNNSGKFELNAPDVNVLNYKKPISEIGEGEIPKGAQFVEIALKNVIKASKINVSGLKITTNSEFKSTFGFGSSSASTVCMVKALSELYGLNLSSKEIFELSFKTVLDIQKKGSGFDVAAAVYGGTLYFVTGGKVIESLKLTKLPLTVGYSGIKADTVELINKVSKKFENSKKRLDAIYSEIEEIVEKARGSMVFGNWEEMGRLMNDNQELLNELGVSIKKLDDMIRGSIKSGAYGAKLSGAGGGDCMIAIGPLEKFGNIKNGIKKAGGQVLKVTTNAPGVRIEK